MFSDDQRKLDINRNKSKESSKKHREKYKASQEAFMLSVKEDLLGPIQKACELLSKQAPRKLKEDSDILSLEKKLNFFKKIVEEVQKELSPGLRNWQNKYQSEIEFVEASEQLSKAKQAIKAEGKTSNSLPKSWLKKLR